jgi:hypothetical protein
MGQTDRVGRRPLRDALIARGKVLYAISGSGKVICVNAKNRMECGPLPDSFLKLKV